VPWLLLLLLCKGPVYADEKAWNASNQLRRCHNLQNEGLRALEYQTPALSQPTHGLKMGVTSGSRLGCSKNDGAATVSSKSKAAGNLLDMSCTQAKVQ
jgi:hypothetical protein